MGRASDVGMFAALHVELKQATHVAGVGLQIRRATLKPEVARDQPPLLCTSGPLSHLHGSIQMGVSLQRGSPSGEKAQNGREPLEGR